MPREGGYAPEARGRDGAVNDPETFLGLTINEWVTAIPRLSAREVQSLPDDIESYVTRIQQASGSEQRRLTSDLMRHGARMTDPMGPASTQAATGVPARSLHLPASDNTAAENRSLDAMKNIAYGHYYQKYVNDSGFGRYPSRIQDDVVDFGINGGIPRARWATVKAMREANIITEEEFRTFPYVTSSQANGRGAFGSDGPGAGYSDPAINNRILAHLDDASPSQLAAMEGRYHVWQRTYYQVLAQEDPDFSRYLDGWMARTAGREGQTSDVQFTAGPAPARRPTANPREEPREAQRPTNLPAGETIGLDVQFRRGRGGLGGGTIGINDAVAVEIPGRGVVTFAVDRDGDYVAHRALPPGVQMLARTDSGSSLPAGVIANPYPREPTLTWLDPHGHRVYLPLSRNMTNAIAEAQGVFIGSMRTGMNATTEFARDARGLAHSDSDQLQIVQTPQGQRFQVLDMDRPTQNGNVVAHQVTPPIVSDHHPATPRGR